MMVDTLKKKVDMLENPHVNGVYEYEISPLVTGYTKELIRRILSTHGHIYQTIDETLSAVKNDAGKKGIKNLYVRIYTEKNPEVFSGDLLGYYYDMSFISKNGQAIPSGSSHAVIYDDGCCYEEAIEYP